MSAKVRMLKDVKYPISPYYPPPLPLFPFPHLSNLASPGVGVGLMVQITLAISSEIKSSTSLADNMNDSFDNTRVRLRGTMNRMLRMAERTGVGWKAWLLVLMGVFGVFFWVWIF